jgi:hypothetical protein
MPVGLTTDAALACDDKRAEDLLQELAEKLNVSADEREALRRRAISLAIKYREHRNAPSIGMAELRDLLERMHGAAKTLIRHSKTLHQHIPATGPTIGWDQAFAAGRRPTETREDKADRDLIDHSVPVLKKLRGMLERRLASQRVTQAPTSARHMREGISPKEYLAVQCCAILEERGIEPSGSGDGALCTMIEIIHELATGEMLPMRKTAEQVAKQWKLRHTPGKSSGAREGDHLERKT